MVLTMCRLASLACAISLALASGSSAADSFTQTNLVSSVPGLARTTDPNLVNPWGVSFTATSPFWVSNQGTNTSTLYDGAGNKTALTVQIPTSATPPNGPTGQVANSTTGFQVGGTASHFIFANLNGTISAWSAGTSAVTEVPATGAVYTGLALATSGNASFLYAANTNGSIDVFNSNWAKVTPPGNFVDPNLPAGYEPFNVEAIGSTLYVTYARLTPQGAPLPGGWVSQFNTDGTFIRTIASNGPLDAPWGLVIAPAAFGSFSNDLLIGNFGDGEILAYDPLSDAFLGTIDGSDGQPLVNSFLWALATRTGGANIDPNAVYFTAGIDDQTAGLFGEITVTTTPEPATLVESATGLLALLLLQTRLHKRRV